MSTQVLVIGVAVWLTIVGMWMRGRIHRYRMEVEEAAKDQLMTSEVASERLLRYRRVSAFCVAAGIGLMVFSMLFLGN